MPKSKEPRGKEIPFEAALKRLEQIVQQMETRDAALEESLALFEEGVALARRCQKDLESARGRVELLLKDMNQLKPLEEEEETDHVDA